MFADRAVLAERYAGWLADAGTVRGLIGPREVPRLWERHILNSAVLVEAIPADVRTVADIGSGAGLPGIPVAIARPDLEVTLIEPLLRRTTFLEEVVADLGLSNVTVVRGRAEELVKKLPGFDVVTSRAVAPLDRLAKWSLPLVRPGGMFLPMKGELAAAELREHAAVLRRLGTRGGEVRQVGADLVQEPVTVIVLHKAAAEKKSGARSRRKGS